MSLNTLLFDLDGTLLPFDLDDFMKGYFNMLTPRLIEYLTPDDAVRHIWAATKAMMQNESPTDSNLEVFRQVFFRNTGLSEVTVWPIFDDFYESDFPRLRNLTAPNPISREMCRSALDKGYELVLATNPIFPLQATRQRMEWAGIADLPFRLVTTMEDMHYCKPNPKYYLEILERLDLNPAGCMMAGNDVQEDGVAGKVGIETYLVTDCLIDRERGYLEFNHKGTLEDLAMFIDNLPPIHS